MEEEIKALHELAMILRPNFSNRIDVAMEYAPFAGLSGHHLAIVEYEPRPRSLWSWILGEREIELVGVYPNKRFFFRHPNAKKINIVDQRVKDLLDDSQIRSLLEKIAEG